MWETPPPTPEGPALPAPMAGLTALLFVAVLAVLGAAAFTVWHYAPAFAAHAAPAPTANRPAAGGIAPFFTPEVRHWEKDILRWAADAQLDPNLVATVMQIESCGDPQARSVAGARGLFQVMPFHFAAGENPDDPDVNARRGLAYLRRAWEQSHGDVALTLAGYNGGLGIMAAPRWPAETQIYVRWGAAIYADAAAGQAHSQALEGWLATRGLWLCRQAHRRLKMGD